MSKLIEYKRDGKFNNDFICKRKFKLEKSVNKNIAVFSHTCRNVKSTQ